MAAERFLVWWTDQPPAAWMMTEEKEEEAWSCYRCPRKPRWMDESTACLTLTWGTTFHFIKVCSFSSSCSHQKAASINLCRYWEGTDCSTRWEQKVFYLEQIRWTLPRFPFSFSLNRLPVKLTSTQDPFTTFSGAFGTSLLCLRHQMDTEQETGSSGAVCEHCHIPVLMWDAVLTTDETPLTDEACKIQLKDEKKLAGWSWVKIICETFCFSGTFRIRWRVLVPCVTVCCDLTDSWRLYLWLRLLLLIEQWRLLYCE